MIQYLRAGLWDVNTALHILRLVSILVFTLNKTYKVSAKNQAYLLSKTFGP